MRYKLKAPFMTRRGQFDKGKQTLVCGVLEEVILTGEPQSTLEMTMGKSTTIYRLTCQQLRNARHTVWTNPKGKRVWVIPVSEFKMEVVPLPPIEPKVETKTLF